MTGRQLAAIEEVVLSEKPDFVLVYGDTNSTLAGALAAAKLHIPIGHVEAGLRSYNKQMPEEINRILTDHVSTLLFTPTKTAVQNLKTEGFDVNSIKNVGDVMFDATKFYESKAKRPQSVRELINGKDKFVLATIHRAENTDEKNRFERILLGLERCGEKVIFPIHPRTRKLMKSAQIRLPKNVHAIDPVGYLEMIWLESECEIVVTDSGGVQKEAYFHRKKCVTVREETEWMELVEIGCKKLVGADPDAIAEAIQCGNSGPEKFDLYGEGKAGELIVKELSQISF